MFSLFFNNHVLEVAAAAREVLAKVTQLHQERPVQSIWESLCGLKPSFMLYFRIMNRQERVQGF